MSTACADDILLRPSSDLVREARRLHFRCLNQAETEGI